jgi:hypothetical protein
MKPTETPYEKTVFIPDLHAPYIDTLAFHVALAFLRFFKPHVVFVMGDVVDFYQISKFVKNPSRLMQLQDDLDVAQDALSRIRKAAPQARIYFIKGNHEERLNKFLWTRAAELVSLRDLTVEHLLGLDKFRMTYVKNGLMEYRGIIVKHGTTVRKHSGYTATAELDESWISGVSAHTHRLGHVYKRNASGVYGWVESGCLCDLNPEYAEGRTMNWQHGLVWGYFNTKKTSFEVHTAPIIDGKIRFGGTEIRP